MPAYAYGILLAGWLVWLLPFVLAKRSREKPKEVDRRARWGILLVALSYAILWQNSFWARPLPWWRIALSVVFFVVAALLSWTGTRSVGRQWRLDAGLSVDHELVTGGPYRLVRHPIYTSMLFNLLGIGFMITPLAELAVALAVFLVGTEIRVRIEDRLLESQFGERFREYRSRLPAYLPFIK